MGILTIKFSAAQPPQPVTNPQFDPAKGIEKAKHPMPVTDQPDWIEIYQQSNFRGSVARYSGNIPAFEYPIYPVQPGDVRRSISIKVAPGYIAYITFDEDNATESIVFGNRPTFGADYPNNIKSIRIVPSGMAYLNLGGIGTQVHNNDCKRIFGTIKVKVFERITGGTFITCPLTERQGIPLTESELLRHSVRNGRTGPLVSYDTAILFDRRNSFPSNSMYDGAFVNYDGRTIPTIANTFLLANGRSDGLGFLVSQAALNEGRIFVEVYTDLGVQHKSGDLATDYSSNVKMQSPVKNTINYNSSPSSFSIGDGTGDFIAEGNPDSNYGIASGVRFSIRKQLRVFLNKQRTPGPVRRGS